MKYPILLLATTAMTIATPLQSENLQKQNVPSVNFCNNIMHLNNIYYGEADHININGIPADMSVHFNTGNIYFTLISEQMKMTLQVMHPNGKIDAIQLAGLGQSSTVDNLNDIVYLATDNGVYKYKEDGTLQQYTAFGEDVMYIAVTNDGSAMYIATWPQNRVHRITNEGRKQETFMTIPNGHGLTIDDKNNIYFIATKTTYILKNGGKIPIKIKGLPADKMTGVFSSNSDEMFGMDEQSNLYAIDPENASATLLGSFNVDGVNTFAMDSANNVIIGAKGKILRSNAFDHHPCSIN